MRTQAALSILLALSEWPPIPSVSAFSTFRPVGSAYKDYFRAPAQWAFPSY